jgi:hypothetical protein
MISSSATSQIWGKKKKKTLKTQSFRVSKVRANIKAAGSHSENRSRKGYKFGDLTRMPLETATINPI